MSWTNIPNGNLAVGAPIRSVDQLALRDNPIAIAEGATGAPRVRAQALNGGQSGTAPIFAARAWVNFDASGTTSGSATIRASGNISSVARNGTGDFTINFTTSMIDANYSILGMIAEATTGNFFTGIQGRFGGTRTASSYQISIKSAQSALQNMESAYISVFR
jgi:hypothetical protein